MNIWHLSKFDTSLVASYFFWSNHPMLWWLICIWEKANINKVEKFKIHVLVILLQLYLVHFLSNKNKKSLIFNCNVSAMVFPILTWRYSNSIPLCRSNSITSCFFWLEGTVSWYKSSLIKSYKQLLFWIEKCVYYVILWFFKHFFELCSDIDIDSQNVYNHFLSVCQQ